MRVTNIIEKIRDIDGAVLREINMGMGVENRLKIEILHKEDYLKWDYFCKRLKEECKTIKVQKRFPFLTFVFPLQETPLKEAVNKFENALDRKFYLIEEPPEINMTIIAKVTNLCNIDCQYCYDRPFREALGHNKIISIDKVDRMIELAAKHAREVTIIWHGGEPTLAGVDFYKRIYEEVFPKYPYACFFTDLQTNGTLIDDNWISLAKKYNIGIGSSYNATNEDLRHTTEDNVLGSKKHNIHNTLDNVKKARDSELPIGVIDVITKENFRNLIDVYEFYKKEGVNSCFNEVHNAGEAEKHDFLFMTKEEQEEYTEIMSKYFAHWARDIDDGCYTDRFASEYIQILFTGSSNVCHNSSHCVNHWVGVNSNGDIFPCDRALRDKKYRIGNINEFNSFLEAYNSEKYINYADERECKLITYCSKCNIVDYCHGNCPMIDIDENNSAAIPNKYSCQMVHIHLLCAYKALIGLDINECNFILRRFLIENCLFLPDEIPELLEKLGMTKEFKNLDFKSKESDLYSKEFELFRAINSPKQEYKLSCKMTGIMDYSLEENVIDDRFDRAVGMIKARAESLEKNIKSVDKEVLLG